MSVGNNRMRRRGLLFSLIGSVVMAGGLAGLFIAYSQLAAAQNDRVPAQLPAGFWFYAVLCAAALISTLALMATRKGALEAKMEMKEPYKLFLLFLPVLALAFVFSYLPLWGWRYAFFDYKAGGELTRENFVGLR